MVRSKTRILVAGASGYIGVRLSLFLSNMGFEIIALCNKNKPKSDEWISKMFKVIIGDVNTKEVLFEIESLKPDIIIHLISLDHFRTGIDTQESIDINVLSTWNLLELSKKIGVCKFIYFSTFHVYGLNKEKILVEDCELNPSNIYGLTHKISEDFVNLYNRTTNLCGVNLRLSNSYGEPFVNNNNAWGLVVNDFCKSAYENNKIIINSDGNSRRDFIHYSNICNAILEMLKLETLNYEHNAYNLSSGNSISILNLAKLISYIFKQRYDKVVDVYINRIERVDNSNIPKDLFELQIPNNRIRSLIEFEEKSLTNGINLIFDSFEK